jgi:hypothetical protein
MTKCIICGERPVHQNGCCNNCDSKIEADKRGREAEKPAYFLTYRGYVVGLFRNGDGKLKPRLLRRNPEHLPKQNTIDLNHYCTGYTREKIKSFKACVLSLSQA